MTKPVRDWGLDDVLAFVGEIETATLEFKASDALGKETNKKQEISKDVGAMANSAGGVIIYGMKENRVDGTAKGIDEGTDITAEQLEQIIQDRVIPKVAGLYVHPIPLENGRRILVVDVPQASTYAPHQSADCKYYKRGIRTCEPMLHYEIEDVRRRADTPELETQFNFRLPSAQNYAEGTWLMQGILINKSNSVVLYSAHDLVFDERLLVRFARAGIFQDQEIPPESKLKVFQGLMAVPQNSPIYRERSFNLFEVIIRPDPLRSLMFSCVNSCPGFHKNISGFIVMDGDTPRFATMPLEGTIAD